jgi:ubiquinol-cytochrome c reductase cytochrome c subunit
VRAIVTRSLVASLAAALVLAAPAAPGPPSGGIVHANAQPGTPLRQLGEELYAGNCARCHGSAGEGIDSKSAGGPTLRGVGAGTADLYLRTGYMPLARPTDQPTRSRVLFSDREIRALVAYVASLGGGPPVPKPHPERGDIAAGQRLFATHCAGCHQIAAEGGYVTGVRVPPLEDATPVQIAEAVRTGPYVMPRFSSKNVSDAELDSVIAYVQYAKDPKASGGWALGDLGPIPEGIVTWLIAAVALVATCLLIGKRLRGDS